MRFCCALYPYVSIGELEEVAAILSVVNPLSPCMDRRVDSEAVPILPQLDDSLVDYSALTGDATSHYIHYFEMGEQDDSSMRMIEVLAIVIPSSLCDRDPGLYRPLRQRLCRQRGHFSMESTPITKCVAD